MLTNTDYHKLYSQAYLDRRVLVTGHTGFKGTWLTQWLLKLGANVTGIGLSPTTTPNHHDCIQSDINEHIIDIRDDEGLVDCITSVNPEIVFHLAAQPLVRKSYRDPKSTFETNIIGTVNVYEACRKVESLRGIVSITSDKVYENKELRRGYKEEDTLGGRDPYSNSKACVEIVTDCYQKCYFNNEVSDTLIATVRAGNVIGGGDWAEDRIIADIARASASGVATKIRNPNAIRPWQHVLDPLSGYLLVGQHLLAGNSKHARAWNFGPAAESTLTVEDVVTRMSNYWEDITFEKAEEFTHSKETNCLMLDSSKAKDKLDWTPTWNFETTIKQTADWYRAYYQSGDTLTDQQLRQYISDAIHQDATWA